MSFWKEKTLSEMTGGEWESLCDGCAMCCLIRLEDEDTGDILQSNICCKYLDRCNNKCTDYAARSINVPDCVSLTLKNIPEFAWLPPTCSYRLVHEGKDLPEWHYLISGDKKIIRKQNLLIDYNAIISESDVGNIEDYIFDNGVMYVDVTPEGESEEEEES